MLAGDGQAKHWMKLAQWKHPKEYWGIRHLHVGQDARTFTGNTERCPLPLSLGRGTKLSLAHHNLMSVSRMITVDSKLPFKKILVELSLLNVPG